MGLVVLATSLSPFHPKISDTVPTAMVTSIKRVRNSSSAKTSDVAVIAKEISSYINYLDIVQAEYFRNLGIRIYDEKVRSYFDTATVKATLEYKAPARVEDVLDWYTRVSKIGSKSLTMETEMYREGDTPGDCDCIACMWRSGTPQYTPDVVERI